ncbi:hypothetical protein L3X38_012081 [Prunus dulcis]|uniref:DUF4219 domain-containing protein n=1 Tax=Prunus dulcis TaxID=3755 RepID=A0AAD4WIY5_PRUDU|nr:hypothetical protein L3X38_012081 [Prunus dulcis]
MGPPHHLKHKEKAHLGITGIAEMQNSQGSTPCELALGMQQGDWLWVCTLQRVGPYLTIEVAVELEFYRSESNVAGSSGGELRAPIFNGENYDFWSIRMKTIFKSHLVIKGFDDTDLKKSDESDDKKKETEESSGKGMVAEVLMKDAKALGLIQGAVSEEIFPRISHEETSKGAWSILQQEFHGDKQVRSVKLQGLRREFEYTRMKDDESLTAYVTKLFDLINQMRSYGEELPRERIVQKLLFSLPSTYDSICSVIEHSRDLN